MKVAPQSLRRLQGRICSLCRQARGWRLDRLIETLRPIVRGWIVCFQLSEVKVALVRQDEWLRRWLCCILWRQ
ncbi:MAG: group II intron maturase-specific domain-containing protein [Candidatus Latescibacterota bacterium]|nr:group II intron maturase-specific domain-containing protein [Candidatus Latescibacterota bacterium]